MVSDNQDLAPEHLTCKLFLDTDCIFKAITMVCYQISIPTVVALKIQSRLIYTFHILQVELVQVSP